MNLRQWAWRVLRCGVGSHPASVRPRPQVPALRPPPDLCEPLEPRLVLYGSPFLENLPTLAMMDNADNTVVRMQTSLGIVDIEMYDRGGPGSGSAAPRTVANFLRYVTSGRYDGSFFHRLVEGFVLQGGGFSFIGGDAPPRVQAIPTDPPIQNEFNADRSNIARTIAMAKQAGDPDSATSQFFFNLVDNSSNLNVQNGGFTVFGRVIQGWEVIEDIAELETRDLDLFLEGQSTGQFGNVPLRGPADSDLVEIIDIAVIKPAGVSGFFTQAVYFPDGYRSGRIAAAVDLVNPDPNASISYEIIARFETGQRDQVIASGTLVAGAHRSEPISRGGDPTLDRVRADAPFAYEIRATGPIAATLRHRDFGALASEAFLNPGPFTATQLSRWSFASGVKGAGHASFLVWANLSDQEVTVNVFFTPELGPPFFISQSLGPYRRGGLDIGQLPGVPEGAFVVRIAATGPIVAHLSQYQASPSRAGIAAGVPAGGSTVGILPGAILETGGSGRVSVFFADDAPPVVIVDFDFILADGTTLTNASVFVLSPGVRRRDLDLATANAQLPRDQFFTIRYRVRDGTTRVSATYTATAAGDTITTPFQHLGTGQVALAGGFTSPARPDDREVVSVWNPFTNPNVEFTYRLRFHFADSDEDEIIVPAGGTGTLAPGRAAHIRVRDLPEILARIQSDPRFLRYSITLEVDARQGTSTLTPVVFAQLTRLNPAQEAMTLSPLLLSSSLTPITSPALQ